MATLTMAQAYAYARKAGFDPASAVIAAAIAMGESGLRTDARGDTGLQTDVWGPSVGLMQIRTVKVQTGTGGERDITKLDDPLQNMLSAFKISSGGRDWTPWTVYTSGKYRQFLGQANTAVTDTAGGTIVPAGVKEDWSALVYKVGDWMLLWTIAGAGLALVVLGGARTLGGRAKP